MTSQHRAAHHSTIASVSRPPQAVPRRKAFTVVLAIELWERFGYYGMQAVLTLFMIEQLHMPDTSANLMLGAFSALTYITPLLGGWVGDRILGARRTLALGAVILTLGYALLAIFLSSPSALLVAMALISTGNGLFKPNAGNLVRRIYEGDDAELDAAFTIYYMAVNIGSTVSMLLTPWLQTRYGSSAAFGTCAVGLVIGLIYYAVRRHLLADISGTPERSTSVRGRLAAVLVGVVVCTAATALILGNTLIARLCVIVAGVVLVVGWGILYVRTTPSLRPGLRLAYLLCAQTMLYFIFYQQMFSSLTLFAVRDVSGDFRLGGITLFQMSGAQFQSLNSVWIMVFSPILATLYNRFGAEGRDLALPHKILIGFTMILGAFALWWFSAATTHDKVSAWIMFAGYGLMSLGELLTTGLGLAVIARYAPAALSGFLMGGLYLLWGIAMYVGGVMANEAAIPPDLVATATAASYAPLFRTLTLSGAAFVLILALLLPLAQHWAAQHAKLNAAPIAR